MKIGEQWYFKTNNFHMKIFLNESTLVFSQIFTSRKFISKVLMLFDKENFRRFCWYVTSESSKKTKKLRVSLILRFI